ncbi:MAG: type VI secretion system contractile sheath large subunit, partial [Syntrophobacteria bacterium]
MAKEKEKEEVQAAEAVAIEPSEFDLLLKKEFKPKSDHARDAINSAVRTLAEQALSETTLISEDAVSSIEAIIAEIDMKLSEQINLIMHHEDFQALEGSWRGLHHLVNNTETDETLKIRVLNLPKKDLAKTLKKYKGTAWDQSPLFKKLYEEEFGSPGGEPYGCLIGDYYFDNSPPDVEILNGMAQIAAAAHAPLISAAAPTLMNMDSWNELSNPRD